MTAYTRAHVWIILGWAAYIVLMLLVYGCRDFSNNVTAPAPTGIEEQKPPFVRVS